MKCVKCGRELETEVLFCPYCGEKVVAGTLGEDLPIYQAEVKGLLKSGKLTVYQDRTEFITSSVQKTIFDYSSLISVKKGLDRILFVTADGRTESCPASRKVIHEAFLYIEKASRPYIAERSQLLLSQGIHYSFISSLGLTGGVLNIGDDRAEFTAKSGQSEVVRFQDVKSAGISMGMLEFSLTDGTSKSFALDKEIRDEVLAFVQKAIAPYVAERKEALLAKGIYFSFPSSQGSDSGTLSIFSDRVEFASRSGRDEVVFFRDVRAVCLLAGMLELSLTDGTSKSFRVDRDVWEEVLTFAENAIRPYVLERTEGFDTSFGIDERIEINEARGVFHILRQGGAAITGGYPLGSLTRCEQTVCSGPGSMLGSVLSGGMSILNSAAGAMGMQQSADDKVSSVGVLLTIRTEQDVRTESVRFGDFPLGMSRASNKYDPYIAEVAKFMDYLESSCPGCECAIPAPPVPEIESEPLGIPADTSNGEEAPKPDGTESGTGSGQEKDQFGITKYIEGVSRFIGSCTTPMTIAIQGNWGSGKNSVMKLLSSQLEARYQGNLIWFSTWQFSPADLDEPLPMLVGKELISQLSGVSSVTAKDRAIKVAKGLINITSGFISQGSTDGQNFMDALFKDTAANSPEKLAKVLSELVGKRTGGENNKVILFIDDLETLASARRVELLEVLRNFFGCEGCVFVIPVDYSAIIRGAEERYGQSLDEKQAKTFFDKLFQVSFRVPVSGYNIEQYVKENLERIEIHTGGQEELACYVQLIRHSVGGEPESMARLFNSFLLLKNMADEELYENKDRRLMLFALVCMQTKFQDAYDFLVRMKDNVTPEFLSGLWGDQSEVLRHSRFSDDERAAFRDFARIISDIINIDRTGGISESECSMFAEVLDFSSITSK